jgi:hypothetical protein
MQYKKFKAIPIIEIRVSETYNAIFLTILFDIFEGT